MERDCCCGGEAGLQLIERHDALIQLLRKKDARLRRMIQLLVGAVLLCISTSMLLVFVAFKGRHHPPADNQTTAHTSSYSSVVDILPPEESPKPSAMLTVPNIVDPKREYLEWESKMGNGFCNGGFTYSDGVLVVPKTGIYKVFLQITYSNHSAMNDLILSNTVFCIMDSYNMPVTLLSSFDSVTHRTTLWKKSLFTSGMFFLEANSKLFVKSSHPKLIHIKKEDLIFFGAELLT